MSWLSEYQAALKEEEKKKRQKILNSSVVSSDYKDALMASDIRSGFSSTRSVYADNLTSSTNLVEKEKEKDKSDFLGLDLFQDGVWDDGYQFGDLTKTILGTAGDAVLGVTKGVVSGVEGLADLGGYAASGIASLLGDEDYAKRAKDLAAGDLTGLVFSGAEDFLDQYSVLGDTSTAVAEGVGQLALMYVTGGASKAAGLGKLGTSIAVNAMMGATSFSQGMSEAYRGGATDGEAFSHGAMSAAAEIIGESLFGGLGKGINAVGFGKGISSLDDMTAKAVSKFMKSQTGKNMVEFGIKSGFEGLEELATGFAQSCSKKLTYMSEEDFGKILEDENLFEQFVVGTLVSGVAQGGDVKVANKTGKDFVTGFTKNEQKVIDKVYKDKLAEAEKKGKVTSRQKSEIYDEVLRDMERGYIKTDTIEEIFGGDSYKAYTDYTSKVDSINKEYEALKNKENATLEEQARFREVRREYYRNQATSEEQTKALKSKLSKDVYDIVKNDRLAESYRERGRIGEDFKYDPNTFKGVKHEGAAKQTYENAIKAGANNSNRVHDMVDMLARSSGDTGLVYDFASAEDIKNTFIERQTKEIAKFEALENRTAEQDEYLAEMKDLLEKVKSGEVIVDGDISGNGIVLNLDSEKPWNRVFGHEVTHSLEKAKAYEDLKTALFNYAKTKGVDIDKQLKLKQAQYAGVKDANAEAELVADMVGDYLFTDKGFVQNLAVEHRNVFQKIWDEIKYLCKIATAGSQEKRDFERLQKAFEDAYREASEASVKTETKAEKNTPDGMQFSLEKSNNRKYNKRSRYSETETLFLSWENGSAPIGEVKKFARFGKTRYYEKTESGCVELSRSQYNERTGVYVEKNYRRAEREIGEANDYDASTQGGIVGHPNSNRDPGGTVSVFGQTFRDELQHDTAGSVPSTLGYDSRTDIKQSEYSEEASDDSGASFVTFSNDYATIRNFMKDGDVAPTKYSLGYHAGDLGKAEGYWNMVSSNRGTGHFGTGTYFVGDETKISDSHYGNRPHEKVEFDNYHLFKPVLESDGFDLHSALKYINDNIFNYPIAKMSHHEMWDIRKQVDDAEYTLWDEDATDAEKTAAQKVLDDFKERFGRVGYDPNHMDAQELYEELSDISREYHLTRSKLEMIFARDMRGLNFDEQSAKIDSIMQGIYDEVSQIEDAYSAKHEDSPSTRFMKALGYEGIDVRGFKGLDNTTYGSVIYDLKGKDLARKQEIGTAKYSLTDSRGKTLYTGSPVTDIKQFKVGGANGAKQTGDRYGRGIYLTTNKTTAKGYAGDSGRVYETNADDLNIFNLNDTITEEMRATLRRELGGKDKQFRNSVLRSFRSEKTFTDFESAEQFFDEQRKVWKEEDGYYSANKPEIKSANDKTGEAVIEYTDFANIDNAIGNLTGNQLYDALKSISTDDFASFITGHGFDGIAFDEDSNNQQYVIYRNEDRLNILNDSDFAPTAEASTQFSLSNAVEETKDLVALHNLTADKLSKSLDLGGLPMPSLAITKADIPHDNFGDITLIFGKETIDPKANKKNKVYSADAWTPIFPNVEYEADSKVVNNVSQKLGKLEGLVDKEFKRDLSRIGYSIEDYLNRQGGEEGLIQYVMDNYGLKAAYLEDIGNHIEPVTKQQEVPRNFNPAIADKYLKVMEILGVNTAEEVYDVNLKEARDNYGAELEKVFPGITQSALRMGKVLGSVASYLKGKDSPVEYKTVTDSEATRKAVDDALDAEGFEAWTRNLFSGVEKDSGIYNNKDLFTPSGNRRSFKQTHLPVTLENIVKAMASQNDGNSKNVSGFNGVKTLRAATAETFKSIDEMHQRKGRLQHLTQEQADAVTDELQSRLYKIIETIDNENAQKGDRNSFIRFDQIGQCIAEIGEGGKYNVTDIQSAFEEYGRPISDDTAMEVKQLLYDVTQMPVNIFEAKPQRVVSFDEAKVFVLPNNVDAKLKQELLNKGYSIAEYDPNVEGDRQRVVNQYEEYQFSLSNKGEEIAPIGNYDFYGSEFTKKSVEDLDAPVVAENATVAETEVADYESDADSLESQLYRAEQVLDALDKEVETLFRSYAEQQIADDEFQTKYKDIDERYTQARQEYERLNAEMTDINNRKFESLDDSDVPPEIEAPYQDESEHIEPADPFAERDMYDVGKKNVKAYMYENPEFKPFFQEAARVMLGDLHSSTKGERWYNEQLHYDSGGEKGWGGTRRNTTEDIADLLDQWHYTYDEIEAGLNAIIEDNGKENNAVSKRIEFMLDSRLRNGYKDVEGRPIPRSDEYINLLKEKQIDDYRHEAMDSFMENADKYAPPEEDFAPLKVGTPLDGEQNALDGFEQSGNEKTENVTRSKLHRQIVDSIKSAFSRKGFDFDEVLRKAKNLSTWATVDNTPQRVMEKSLGYKEGGILSDITVNKVAQNETDGIKWLNSFTDRKSGILAQLSKKYNIKPGSKESAAAQMYAEGFYVTENNDIVAYGDAELAQDFPDVKVQNNIKGLAKDPVIRQIYDDTLARINESRTRNAYPEIQRLDNYFLHFRAMDDTFSRLGLPFNPNDIRAKDLPTDLNGVTADLKPGQPYFASAMHRKGKRTSFDLLGGLERYLTSAKNQIYHIDDIQTLRALRNYIADTYGQANGLEGLDVLTEEEAQERIEQVFGSHLSTFAKFLNEEANVLAGKTALIDRGLEGVLGRRWITAFDTINKQVGSNMVGFSVSSALTNFDAIPRAFVKSNKADFVKAFAQTVSNKIRSVYGQSDGFAENSPVMIRRKGADRFSRAPFQKVSDAGYVLMGAVDDISTELIARTKYNEFTRKGMDSQQAHFETDKWVSKLMGDRSLGQQPQLYNSKMLGLITKFQLEVRNNLDSMFYDTIQEAKVSTEDIENGLARNAKKAAKVTSTMVGLAVAQHIFGKAFESVAGYNPSFDIISTLIKAFGWDDEEEEPVLDNIEQAFLELVEDMPYTSTFTGGRIPIASALPIEELVTGKDEYGNEKSRLETLGEIAPYYVLPGGYGQIKKTTQGLGMFSGEHPVAGSYTDSGNLRFPMEDTFGNRVQAALFGQYANENARDYFDNNRSPLKEKQIQEFIDVDIPIRDYWEYREGLADQDTIEDKFDYIAGLDLPVSKKNILINNIVDRDEDVDLEGYEDFSSYDEFDFATKNPGKYAISQAVGGYSSYTSYMDVIKDIEGDKDASGKTISGSKKKKVVAYIESLPIDYGMKIILHRSLYDSKADRNAFNAEIVEYLNSRQDISYEDFVAIVTELGMTVSGNNVYWD